MWEREDIERFWSLSFDNLLQRLETTANGLSTTEAKRRLRLYGRNRLRAAKGADAVPLLLSQFKNPLILSRGFPFLFS